MGATQPASLQDAAASGQPERRRYPRIYGRYPAVVRGIDAQGQPFKEAALLISLSAGGLYLVLSQPVRRGTSLFTVVHLASTCQPARPTPRLALRGRVHRVEPLRWQTVGVAVRLTSHRFLSNVPPKPIRPMSLL